MDQFVVGLTNEDPAVTIPVFKQYRYVQYLQPFPASATAPVSFDQTSDTFRYVIIQKQSASNNAICIAEVRVYLRGGPKYVIMHSLHNDKRFICLYSFQYKGNCD